MNERASIAREDLLRPSLSDEATRLARAPYSETASFLASFFGGPLAAIAMLLADARRLGRLGPASVVAVLAVVAYLAALHALVHRLPAVAWLTSPDGVLGSRGGQIGLRLLALAIFGVGYALHRRAQRSARLFALARPNPWPAGLGAVVLGFAGNALLVRLLA